MNAHQKTPLQAEAAELLANAGPSLMFLPSAGREAVRRLVGVVGRMADELAELRHQLEGARQLAEQRNTLHVREVKELTAEVAKCKRA
jgi:uncharacterized protein involved in exopolysaccharide biosynthesis